MKQIFTDSLRKKNLFANKNAEFIITLNFKSFFKDDSCVLYIFLARTTKSSYLNKTLSVINFISRKTVV